MYVAPVLVSAPCQFFPFEEAAVMRSAQKSAHTPFATSAFAAQIHADKLSSLTYAHFRDVPVIGLMEYKHVTRFARAHMY